MVNDECCLSNPDDETPTFNNGSGGAPFHILINGDWEGKLQIFVRFEGCAEWRETPHIFTDNTDTRKEYPAYTDLKIVAILLAMGEAHITICH